MRGGYVPGAAAYYWGAGQGAARPFIGWDPQESIGVEVSSLWVSHGATAINCSEERVRMASPAEKELLDMMMRLGAKNLD